jgi:hypothetical protein
VGDESLVAVLRVCTWVLCGSHGGMVSETG